MSNIDSSGTQAATPEQNRRSATIAASPASSNGRYLLGDEIARGGMGVVVRATDEVLHREVAIKLLKPQLAGTSAEQQFLEEAAITGQLQHPSIPPVYDLGKLSDGRTFLAMKFVKGRTLDSLLNERLDSTADRGKYVAIFEAICQAVGFAHANGVIHRDLKPSNVMVGAFGEVQVMDWGLAKVITAEPISAPSHGGDAQFYNPRRDAETLAGHAMGTPAYMPPEQARGDIAAVTARSDVFGLGAILCAILTGHPPFSASDTCSAFRRAVEQNLEPAFNRLDACGAEFELITLAKKCLAKTPSDRPTDGSAVAAEIALFRADAEQRVKHTEMDWVAAEASAAAERKQAQLERRIQEDIQFAERHRVKQRTRIVFAIATAAAIGVVVISSLLARTRNAERDSNDLMLRMRNAEEVATSLQAGGSLDSQIALTEQANQRARGLEAKINEAGNEIAFQQKSNEDLHRRIRVAESDSQGAVESLAVANALMGKRLNMLEMDADFYGSLIGHLEAHSSVPQGEAFALPILQRLAKVVQAVDAGAIGDKYVALDIYSRLGLLLMKNGLSADAIPFLEHGYATRSHKLGLGHPDTLKTLDALARGYKELRMRHKCVRLYEDRLRQLVAIFGSQHSEVVRCMHKLVADHVAMGNPDKALPMAKECLRIDSATVPLNDGNMIFSLKVLAEIYADCGDGKRSAATFDQWLDMQMKYTYMEREKNYSNQIPSIASRLLSSGQPVAAERHLRVCLTIREKLLSGAWPTFDTRSMLGRALFAQKRFVEAEPFLVDGYQGMRRRRKEILPEYLGCVVEGGQTLAALYESTNRASLAAAIRAELPMEVAPTPRAKE